MKQKLSLLLVSALFSLSISSCTSDHGHRAAQASPAPVKMAGDGARALIGLDAAHHGVTERVTRSDCARHPDPSASTV